MAAALPPSWKNALTPSWDRLLTQGELDTSLGPSTGEAAENSLKLLWV